MTKGRVLDSEAQNVDVAARARAVDAIVLAFSTDPILRWVYPDAHQYLSHFPAFIESFGGRAFMHDTAYATPEMEGVALWLPPGVHPDDEALVALMQRTIDEPMKTDAFAVLERMDDYHPKEEHWYLPLIGVDPHHHRRGFGGVLMHHALDRCDRDSMIAYLESTNPTNNSFYERHGFELLGTIQVAGSPPMFPMLRQPR
jgi:GNAT superfamily N-acetyltransferase